MSTIIPAPEDMDSRIVWSRDDAGNMVQMPGWLAAQRQAARYGTDYIAEHTCFDGVIVGLQAGQLPCPTCQKGVIE